MREIIVTGYVELNHLNDGTSPYLATLSANSCIFDGEDGVAYSNQKFKTELSGHHGEEDATIHLISIKSRLVNTDEENGTSFNYNVVSFGEETPGYKRINGGLYAELSEEILSSYTGLYEKTYVSSKGTTLPITFTTFNISGDCMVGSYEIVLTYEFLDEKNERIGSTQDVVISCILSSTASATAIYELRPSIDTLKRGKDNILTPSGVTVHLYKTLNGVLKVYDDSNTDEEKGKFSVTYDDRKDFISYTTVAALNTYIEGLLPYVENNITINYIIDNEVSSTCIITIINDGTNLEIGGVNHLAYSRYLTENLLSLDSDYDSGATYYMIIDFGIIDTDIISD